MIPSADSSTSRQKKIFIWAAIVLFIGIGILLYLFLQHPRDITSQAASARNSVQARTSQNGSYTGNTQVARQEETYSALKEQSPPSGPLDEPATRQTPRSASRPFVENPIRSITLYARFTYETENADALPSAVVPFVPFKDANAYLEGPDGTVRLDFISPVRFEKPDDRHIIVIYNFFLPTGSDLYWHPVVSLQNFDSISIPIIETGYERFWKNMVFFQCLFEVNGRYAPSWSYDYMPTKKGETTIRIPITEAVKQRFGEKE